MDIAKLFRDKPGLLDNVDSIVRKEMEAGDVPKDARLVGVGIVDSEGVKAVITVEMLDRTKHPNSSLKVKGIFEHDWDGDDSVAAKIVFSSR